LWCGIVDSSVWEEPDHVVKVWCTILALKDADHVYRGTAFQLSRRAKKTEIEVLDALKILSSPDSRREEQQKFEGRRIEMVEDGWLVLNGEFYRQKMQEEAKKARNRRSQQAWRERQKGNRPLMPTQFEARPRLANGTMNEEGFPTRKPKVLTPDVLRDLDRDAIAQAAREKVSVAGQTPDAQPLRVDFPQPSGADRNVVNTLRQCEKIDPATIQVSPAAAPASIPAVRTVPVDDGIGRKLVYGAPVSPGAVGG
jgi:hypothetical protein